MSFKPGDVVKLKSGSPNMTVNLIRSSDGAIVVTWFDVSSDSIKTEVLSHSVLVLV